MAQIFGIPFGSGKDSTVPASGTYAGTNLSCSGSSGSTTLTYSGTFTNGDLVLIHQSRGTGVGQWEINQIVSAGTLVYPLSYTYTDSGASQAQVIEIKEYTGGTISGTLTCNAWDTNVGGILPIFCNGKLTISGSLSATGKGFLKGGSSGDNYGAQGEGTAGAGGTTRVTTANGNGGGGSNGGSYGGNTWWAGGGGGGNGAVGSAGGSQGATVYPGAGGATSGAAALTTMAFGGGGGDGGFLGDGAIYGYSYGGNGGGICLIYAKELIVTGSVVSGGVAGSHASTDHAAGGGGGAGGSILIKGQVLTLGTNKITAAAGSGGAASGNATVGGAGGAGRIRIEACSYTGTTSPTLSASTAVKSWCNLFGGMI